MREYFKKNNIKTYLSLCKNIEKYNENPAYYDIIDNLYIFMRLTNERH